MTYEKNCLNNTDIDLDKYNKHTGVTPVSYFVVFRIDRRYKTVDSIKGFEIHNLRKKEVQNANPGKTKLNKILIGSENVVEDVKKYIYGIKIRSNANIAVDMIFTVNHEFFDKLAPNDLQKWIDWNIKFLKDNFGDNCISAILHMDETAPHLHVLLCPKFWNEEKKRYELSSNRYFGSKKQMRDWQTKYADHMHSKFSNLVRGIKGSKARHIDIKQYYTLVNKKLNEKDADSVLAHAKNSYLLDKRVRMLENTILQIQNDNDDKQLLKRVEKAEKQTKEYKEVTKAIIKKYNLKKADVEEIIDKVQERSNNSKGRER